MPLSELKKTAELHAYNLSRHTGNDFYLNYFLQEFWNYSYFCLVCSMQQWVFLKYTFVI